MSERTTSRRGTLLAGGALLLFACAGQGCAETKTQVTTGTSLTVQLEYHLDPTEKPADALQLARALIEKRVALIVPAARVLSAEPNRLLVQTPELDAATMGLLRDAVERLGSLEFRLVAPKTSKPYRAWQETHQVSDGYTTYIVPDGGEILVCDRCEVHGANIAAARLLPADPKRGLGDRIGLGFTQLGELELSRVTGDNVGERLAIILDTRRSGDRTIMNKGTCCSAPIIQARIFGDAVIEGDFKLQEAKAIAAALTSGELPAPLVFDKSTPLSTKPPRNGAEEKNK